MRGRISEAKSYAKPVQIGQVMVGGTVGTVAESRHLSFIHNFPCPEKIFPQTA